MNLGSLVSEARNPQTLDLDALSTLELVNRFNQQDTLVALAVKETLPEVAKAVDAAAAALKAGGRIIYMGAGTSGRLGVLDASECPPTFGVPHGLVVGLIRWARCITESRRRGGRQQTVGRGRSEGTEPDRAGSGCRAGSIRTYTLCHWGAGIRQTDRLHHGGYLL